MSNQLPYYKQNVDDIDNETDDKRMYIQRICSSAMLLFGLFFIAIITFCHSHGQIEQHSTRHLHEYEKDDRIGSKEEYEVVKQLGAGGFGVVYLVKKYDGEVFVKNVVLKIPLVHSEESKAELQSELDIQLLANGGEGMRYSVKAEDELVEINEGIWAIEMEWIEGDNLAEYYLVKHQKLTMAQRCILARKVIKAASSVILELAGRECKIKDIKTRNMMRTPKGAIKILDFDPNASSPESIISSERWKEGLEKWLPVVNGKKFQHNQQQCDRQIERFQSLLDKINEKTKPCHAVAKAILAAFDIVSNGRLTREAEKKEPPVLGERTVFVNRKKIIGDVEKQDRSLAKILTNYIPPFMSLPELKEMQQTLGTDKLDGRLEKMETDVGAHAMMDAYETKYGTGSQFKQDVGQL